MEGGKSPATRNRTRDHLIAATLDSQMLCQLSFSRICLQTYTGASLHWIPSLSGSLLRETSLATKPESMPGPFPRWRSSRVHALIGQCVFACVCVCLLVLLQVCRFRLNVEDSKMGGTKRLGRCQGAELLAHLVIRDRGERSGFVLLLASRHCHGNGKSDRFGGKCEASIAQW